MKRSIILSSAAVALALVTISASAADGLPTEQPKLVTIIKESVKPGKNAEHAKHEAGWPAIFEKTKSTDYYVAITSMTGPNEAWYLIPRDSYAAEAESMKREDKDKTLSAELARLAERDSEFISGSCAVQTIGRPDLTVGKFPSIAKARFFHIGTYNIFPGKQQLFEEIAKAYGKAHQRAVPGASYRMYSVVAGMPGPAYIVISSVEDYAAFDKTMADEKASWESATDEEKALFHRLGEAVSKFEYNFFRVDPNQSYVSKEVRDSDPDFWLQK